MIRLVAFDLDGTILDPEGQPDPGALEAIGRLLARGLVAAAISGRSIRRSLQPLANCDSLSRRLHLCGYNGGVGVGPVSEGRRPLLYVRRLPADLFRELVDYAEERELNLVYCRCEEGVAGLEEEYLFRWQIQAARATGDWRGAGYAWEPQLFERIRRGELGPPPKIMLLAGERDSDSLLADLQRRFGRRIYVAWAMKEMLEVMPAEVDKGIALVALCQATGVPLAETLAIGDGNNDLPMLRQAGLGLLMGNAEPEVVQAIDGTGIRLIPSFAEGGFARAVAHYVLAAQSGDHVRA